MLLPVTPAKLEVKVNNQNKQLTTINEGEINILKSPKLTDIKFDVLLPQTLYPFAVYKNGYQPAASYLNGLERLKKGRAPFQFIAVRMRPDGEMLFHTDIKVSLEDYKVTDDTKNGLDITVSISLKQYREYGTKTCNISLAAINTHRSTESSPAPTQTAGTYTVKNGDCLWNIAKKYYGNGSQYGKIYDANTGQISNPNLIYPGQEITIPV